MKFPQADPSPEFSPAGMHLVADPAPPSYKVLLNTVGELVRTDVPCWVELFGCSSQLQPEILYLGRDEREK